MVCGTEAWDQSLECAYHVTEEANSNHFNDHLVDILERSESDDVAVTHRRESGNDPINGGDQAAYEVVLLVSVLYSYLDPPLLKLYKVVLAYKNPYAGEKVADKHHLD